MMYYNQSIQDVLSSVNSSEQGLSDVQVQERLKKDGPNELIEKKKAPAWLLFLNQFKDVMILILIAAAILSGIIGDLTDTIIILVIVLLNATVSFIQEYNAEKAMEALKKMSVTQLQVIRNNKPQIVASGELVQGDIIVLEAGSIVPADLRIIEAHALKIDEASLTGESVAIDKSSHTLNETNITLGDQTNMAFKGTLINNGRGKGVVVATGMRTELGKIADMLQQEDTITPLQKRMAKFGKNLSYIVLGICVILLVSGLYRGEDPFKILLLSVSLAVAAIPEALPALITIALSRGASILAKKNALARKLPAVETLGSVNFICSDKTGTLTQNKMQVVQQYQHAANSFEAVVASMQLCTSLNHDVQFDENDKPFGESTELAIVEQSIHDLTLNQYRDTISNFPRIAEIPFDSDRKCMTTAHPYNNKVIIITKGASEAISEKLKNKEDAETLKNISNEWASKGIRVLAYAYKICDTIPNPFTAENIENELLFIGLTGLMDPPREEVKQAITECKTAGIKPVMITGDHPATAKAIAKEIGILNETDLVITGAELRDLNEQHFADKVEKISVYARVSPDQKLRIVKALQEKGHFIAMTGDGVNDAPSLKAANIGVAMGITGTDVSKEASDLILLDDNFSTIVKAVKEGRRIFDNIRRFVKYIMTCNAAEIWTILLAPLWGMPIPLLPIHILWINLVTDGLPALALANEKAECDIMERKPRAPKESLFSDGVGYHIIWVSILMAGITLGTQAWAINNDVEHWQTMVFTVLALSQLGHVFGVRSDRSYIFKQGLFSNMYLVGAVVLTFILQLLVIYLPFMNEVFKTQPLTLQELGLCVLMAVILFHAVEAEKWIKRILKK
jgi:P-type Ca2+ transporter type 2C